MKQLNSAIALTKVYGILKQKHVYFFFNQSYLIDVIGGHIEDVEIIAASENNVLNKEGQKLTRKVLIKKQLLHQY